MRASVERGTFRFLGVLGGAPRPVGLDRRSADPYIVSTVPGRPDNREARPLTLPVSPERSGDLPALTSLRFLAAAAVFLFHFPPADPSWPLAVVAATGTRRRHRLLRPLRVPHHRPLCGRALPRTVRGHPPRLFHEAPRPHRAAVLDGAGPQPGAGRRARAVAREAARMAAAAGLPLALDRHPGGSDLLDADARRVLLRGGAARVPVAAPRARARRGRAARVDGGLPRLRSRAALRRRPRALRLPRLDAGALPPYVLRALRGLRAGRRGRPALSLGRARRARGRVRAGASPRAPPGCSASRSCSPDRRA